MPFQIQWHRELPSTNTYLKAQAENGEALEGDVVAADFQTAGRGRLGRHWEALFGQSTLFSTLIYPQLEVERIALLGLLVGLSVLEGLKMYLARLADEGVVFRTVEGFPIALNIDEVFKLKWPNDLLAAGKKLGGILCETGLDAAGRRFVVAGVGVNVRQRLEDFTRNLRTPPTSLYLLTGLEIQPKDLLAPLLNSLDIHLKRLRQDGPDWISREFADKTNCLGQEINVQIGQNSITGTFLTIEQDGALGLRLSNGTFQQIYSGDIHK